MTMRMSRRSWLQCGAIAAAGFPIARGGLFNFPVSEPETPGPILLDQNENPYGISPKAQKAVMDAMGLSNRYPGDNMRQLRDLIVNREGVTKDHVILGAGSTEIFSLAGILYGADGKKVLMADPTYFGFKNFIDRAKGKPVLVPLNGRYEHDLDALRSRLTKDVQLVYICNPNNPTGTVVGSGALRSFCEEVSKRTLVFIDEAYHDLAEDPGYGSMIGLVKKGCNIMVARTFSKIHALAGLRVGYGIARPDIVENFRRIQTNFAPVAALSIAAAAASYEDTEFIASCKRKNAETKAFTYETLDRLRHPYIRSQTNFVIFEIPRKAEEFVKDVEKHGILVRPFEFNGRNWVRVSMGTMEEMKKFAAVLEKV